MTMMDDNFLYTNVRKIETTILNLAKLIDCKHEFYIGKINSLELEISNLKMEINKLKNEDT